jgi:hypothetical protein
MTTTLSQLFKSLGQALHRATLPTAAADGDAVSTVADRYGRVVVVGPQPSGRYRSSVLGVNGRIVAQAGELSELWVVNALSEERWLHLFDVSSLSAPANGTSPLERFLVPAKGIFSLAPLHPIAFASGIHWACSTTANTLTIDSGSSFHVSAAYET